MAGDVVIENRAFPLRPVPDRTARFKGTYREEGWRRCARMSAGDGLTFTAWPHETMPGFSLPALEAAKCVARQDPALFDRLHLALYAAYFTDSRNIGDPEEVLKIVAATGADVDRFVADRDAGLGREAVIADYRAALEDGVQSIPTVIVPASGARLVGLADAHAYRAAVQEARA